MRKQNGITLIALVITVIVLLILAGVTINLALGERGIFNKAVTAAEESKIAQYKEQIELARADVAANNMGKVTIDNLADQIVKDKIVGPEGIEIQGDIIKVTTKEGYVFYVKAEGIEYAGTKDELTPPGSMDDYIEKRQIKISVEKSGEWANKKRVTVTSELGYYKIQYSMDGGTTWVDYKGPIEITENKTIYVTLVNKKGEQGEAAQYIIDKIDTTAPEITNVTGALGKITFSASDAESGISGYKITKDTNAPTSFDSIGEVQNTVTDKEVEVGEQGVYYVWVQDQAGNISAYSSATTELIPVTGITVAPDTLNLPIGGEPVKLTATIQPSNAYNKNITWTSSNTSVATVTEEGVVTSVGEGTCDITATTVDGNISATCSVTVKNLVTKITLNETSKILKPNATFKLTATIEPDDATNKTISWSSSNTDVATVSQDGTVTAKAKGKTNITVTAMDGSEVRATCTIGVNDDIMNYSVTNYPIDIDGDGDYKDDWFILYQGDDNKYLISSKLVPIDNLPMDQLSATRNSESNNYAITFNDSGTLTDISEAVARNYLILDDAIPHLSEFPYWCKELLNTSKWSKFVASGFAEDAIGGPTSELGLKGLAQQDSYYSRASLAYSNLSYNLVNWNLVPRAGSWAPLGIENYSGRNNNVTFWKGNAYYLSGYKGTNAIAYCGPGYESGYSGFLVDRSWWRSSPGIRPVVRLKNNISFDIGEDGTFILVQK